MLISLSLFHLQRWRRRWFVLQQGKLPRQYVLNYYTDETKKRLKGTIPLDDCQQVRSHNFFGDIHVLFDAIIIFVVPPFILVDFVLRTVFAVFVLGGVINQLRIYYVDKQ